MESKTNNNVKDGAKHLAIAGYIFGAFISGLGGNYLVMRNVAPETIAPDRYTGSQGEALERTLEYHLSNHPDIANQFDRRITRLEAQYAIILANQDRILNRLDRLK